MYKYTVQSQVFQLMTTLTVGVLHYSIATLGTSRATHEGKSDDGASGVKK